MTMTHRNFTIAACLMSLAFAVSASGDPATATPTDPAPTPAFLPDLAFDMIHCYCGFPEREQKLSELMAHKTEVFKLRPFCKFIHPEATLYACSQESVPSNVVGCQCLSGEKNLGLLLAPTNRLDDLLNECRDLAADGVLSECKGVKSNLVTESASSLVNATKSRNLVY